MGEPASDAAVSTHELREGTLVADKYRLVTLAGSGAMGEVWRARHETLGHGVAIKFLLGHARDSEEAQSRFVREARIAAQLGERSPHVARVLDCGQLADGAPYLVMELLRGEELSAKLKREGRISLELAARLVRQLCRALSVAHASGVVHRDVKPANVFLCATPDHGSAHVKLMDFGVAKPMDGDIETTRQGTVIGTPAYMSPEQVLAKAVDRRTDLWSVGATVYRMVVGANPFGNAGAYAELGVRILSSPPIRPSSLAPDLPATFDAWIEKALAKDPNDRFQTAEELADALALVAGLSDAIEPMPLRSRASRASRAGGSRALKEAPTLSPPVAESASAISVATGVAATTSSGRFSARSGVRRARPPRSRAPALMLLVGMIVAVAFVQVRRTSTESSPARASLDAAAAPPLDHGVPASTQSAAVTPDAAPSTTSSSSESPPRKPFASPPRSNKEKRPL